MRVRTLYMDNIVFSFVDSIAYFRNNQFKNAKRYFNQAKTSEKLQTRCKTWIRKCDIEIAGKKIMYDIYA